MNHDEPLQFSAHLTLPDWIGQMEELGGIGFPTDEAKMRFAIKLAQGNVRHGTGGPFGAAVFNSENGEVISVGVNRVVPLNNSTAHAEMMAFMLAQKRLQQYRLDGQGNRFVLATSAQPCAMCFGACPWAGIERLIVGARREDVESLTEFDEGPMPENWIQRLQQRGIETTQDILREEACAVLREYQNAKGIRY